MPPPDGVRPARRHRRPFAGLDRPAPAAGRHAPDQQRGRRLELRHARARPAHPPLRPVAPARTRPHRPAGPAGRDGRDPRRRAAHDWASGAGAWATPARTASSATPRARRSASAGSWAAPRRRSPTSTTEVLLEAAYFTPMAIARTSKRLGLRTEASARFERGVDPWVIEPSVRRFCQLLAESVPGLTVADGMLDVRGDVPSPSSSRCRSPGCTARSAWRSGRTRSPASLSRSGSRCWSRQRRRGRRRADRRGADEPPRRPARALRDRRRH